MEIFSVIIVSSTFLATRFAYQQPMRVVVFHLLILLPPLLHRRQEAGRIKELDAPANGAVPVVVKKKGGGRGRRQAGAPPPAPRGAGKKAARDKANDTTGLDRSVGVSIPLSFTMAAPPIINDVIPSLDRLFL